MHGHQIVCHWVGNDYKCIDYYNPVDGDEVPVPHAGLAITVEQFHELAERVRKAGIKFIMLTGDKLETADNIARSCKMIDKGILIDGPTQLS